MLVGGAVIVICIPPAVFLWRALRMLADRLSLRAIRRRGAPRIWGREGMRLILSNTFIILVTVSIALLSLPFVFELLLLGRFAAPLPALLLIGVIVLLARTAFRIHGVLEETFSRTFYGSDPIGEPDSDQKPP